MAASIYWANLGSEPQASNAAGWLKAMLSLPNTSTVKSTPTPLDIECDSLSTWLYAPTLYLVSYLLLWLVDVEEVFMLVQHFYSNINPRPFDIESDSLSTWLYAPTLYLVFYLLFWLVDVEEVFILIQPHLCQPFPIVACIVNSTCKPSWALRLYYYPNSS